MRRSIEHNNLTWIDVKNPTAADIRYLEEHFAFHELVLEQFRSSGHRPRVEHHDGYLFFILYYPAFDDQSKTILRREIDVIATKTHIITNHFKTILPLEIFFRKITSDQKQREECMSETAGHLLFYIMREILENMLAKTEHLERKVDEIEAKIFNGEERKLVFEISIAKRDIIDFRRILAPQTSVLESLATEGVQFFGKELEPHFADLRGTFEVTWNEVQEERETIQALAQTNESLLSTKINEIMKMLTVFSVIFLPITLVANLWGMNLTAMPLGEQREGFWVILGFMGILLITMVAFFRKKKWL